MFITTRCPCSYAVAESGFSLVSRAVSSWGACVGLGLTWFRTSGRHDYSNLCYFPVVVMGIAISRRTRRIQLQ